MCAHALLGEHVRYVPAGVDSFVYTATDALGHCATSRVYITVTPPPGLEAGNQTVSACQQTATSFNVSTSVSSVVDVYVNNPQPGTPTYPAHGSLTKSGSVLTYTSAVGFVGVDAFQFVVSDALGRVSVGHVKIVVAQCAPVTTSTSTTSTGTTGTTSTGTTSTGTTSTGTTGTTGVVFTNSGVSYGRYIWQDSNTAPGYWTSDYTGPLSGFVTSTLPYALPYPPDDRSVYGKDGRYARSEIPANGVSTALHVQRFGAVVTGSNAVITGVKFIFQRAASNTGVTDLSARLLINGVPVGANLYDLPGYTREAYPPRLAFMRKFEIGGPSSMWGLTPAELTKANVNTAVFGLQLIVQNSNSVPVEVFIDEIDVGIYWALSASAAAMLDREDTQQAALEQSDSHVIVINTSTAVPIAASVAGVVAVVAVAALLVVIRRRRALSGGITNTKMCAKVSPGGAAPSKRADPVDDIDTLDVVCASDPRPASASAPAPGSSRNRAEALRAAIAARLAAQAAAARLPSLSPKQAQLAELPRDE
eukprot:TRINITY_DN3911_c0_g1_i2.p1 TRINITY_DN3911_c0_g1~~TRINITY_DN3911_c0_g1_i2.p1  ORF type:complete len:565 (+),score=189.46 TRINITY_DN3911_c0_g1_i2:94-1695(+)